MRTTIFGQKLIQAAEEVLQIEYRAGNRNKYGVKLEQVVQEFDIAGGTNYFTGNGKAQVDYCGITVSVILDRAIQAYNGETNQFRSASAAYFKNNAGAFGLRVDKTPRDGCLFLTRRNGGSGYHVGFVWEVSPDGTTFKSIEGNSWSSSSFHVKADGCKIKLGNGEFGILSRARRVSTIDCFVHIEEMFDMLVMDFPKSAAMLADGDIISGAYCSIDDYDVDAEGEEDVNTAGNEKFLGFIPQEYKPYLYIGCGVATLALVAVLTSRQK